MRRRTRSLQSQLDAIENRLPEQTVDAADVQALEDVLRLLRGGDLPRSNSKEREMIALRVAEQCLAGADALPPEPKQATEVRHMRPAFARGAPLFEFRMMEVKGEITSPDELPAAWLPFAKKVADLRKLHPLPVRPSLEELEALGVDLRYL